MCVVLEAETFISRENDNKNGKSSKHSERHDTNAHKVDFGSPGVFTRSIRSLFQVAGHA